MNIKHVTSLEISKKLKELGVKQESEFYWAGMMTDVDGRWVGHIIPRSELKIGTYISAFLVSELGEMLPNNIINYSKDGNQWCCILGKPMPEHTYATFADTESDARGKMLIYLIENNLLKARAQ